MKNFVLVFIYFLSIALYANCIQEIVIAGSELKTFSYDLDKKYFIEIDGRFVPFTTKTPIKRDIKYTLQISAKHNYRQLSPGLDYYTLNRLNIYLNNMKPKLETHGYKLEIIGKSIEGRNLYAIFPNVIQPQKKLVIMNARHHGNESLSNWIVEGFLNTVFNDEKWLNEFELIVYPMMNPDGTVKKERYNANGKDLNRYWNRKDGDETAIVKRHLIKLLQLKDNDKVVLALDMHCGGADFFYRIKSYLIDKELYDIQTLYINTLHRLDKWFSAPSKFFTTGHTGCCSYFLTKEKKFNALTHETYVSLNQQNRTNETLINEGKFIHQAIWELYKSP